MGGHQAAPVGKAVKTHINALALPQKVMANVLKLASPRGPDPTITLLCYPTRQSLAGPLCQGHKPPRAAT